MISLDDGVIMLAFPDDETTRELYGETTVAQPARILSRASKTEA